MNTRKDISHLNEFINKAASNKAIGIKADNGKRVWRFMPWAQLDEVANVLQKGAVKYSPDNWKIVPDAVNRYKDAAMRHILAYMGGDKIDTLESGGDGLGHLAHAICCLLFLMWFDDNPGKEIKETK